ncbi:thioesterase family protein [Hypericibacter adhaerens]|nr:thioesterase family protein [Hypericibacter adhaerens]
MQKGKNLGGDMNNPRRGNGLFVDESQQVPPGWIDYNGHMSLIYYPQAFEHAFSPIYEELALGREMIAATGISLFTAEQHLTFKREVFSGDPLRITTQLIDFGGKSCQWIQAMFHAREGYLSSTCEHLMLFVDIKQRRAAEMPEAASRTLDRVLAAHRHIPAPAETGRHIAMRSQGRR